MIISHVYCFYFISCTLCNDRVWLNLLVVKLHKITYVLRLDIVVSEDKVIFSREYCLPFNVSYLDVFITFLIKFNVKCEINNQLF